MSKTTKIILGMIVVIIIVIGVWYFMTKQTPGGEIKIGALFPLTGGLAQYGEVAQKSAQIAMDEINANGGINGKKLVIDFQDHQCNPQTAVTLFEQLNSVENINIFTSAACSGTVSALAPKLNETKSLLLGTITTANSLTGVSPYFFRNWASDGAEAELLSQKIKSIGINKLGVINEETDYAKGLRTSIEKDLSGTGIIITGESFTTGSTDIRTQLTKLKSENLDAIFLSPQTVTTGDMILKQMTDLGFKPKHIFVNDNILKSLTLLSSYKNLLENAISGDYVPNMNKASNFLAEYNKKYGPCPQPNLGASVYDAIKLLAQAIEKNGYDAEKVKNYLKTINYNGITGNISFDQNNNRSNANYFLFIIKNGKAVQSN